MMAGNIAVFGGNGLTGSEVVYQALERGDTVTAFCRDPSKLKVEYTEYILFDFLAN